LVRIEAGLFLSIQGLSPLYENLIDYKFLDGQKRIIDPITALLIMKSFLVKNQAPVFRFDRMQALTEAGHQFGDDEGWALLKLDLATLNQPGIQ
jgi:hypothetical protein